jgi:small-conductance mechanosensitive channel
VAVVVHGLAVLTALVLRLLAWPVALALFLTYLHFVLQFFPATAPAGRTLHESIFRLLRAALDRFVAYSPNLAVLALIGLVTHFLLRVAATVLQGFERGRLSLEGFYPDWARPTYKIVRFILLAMAVVVMFPYLPGSDSAAFRGVSVFLGVLLSLGSSSAVANAVAGTILTYTRALQPGDFVQIGEHAGTVVDRTLLVTRVRTVKNVVVTIPNSTALGTPVKNLSAMGREQGVILPLSVTAPFDVPWRTVHELLLAAAEGVDGVRRDPPPFVLQTSLADTHVRYELNVYSDQPARQARIFTALHQNIQDRFREAGIPTLVPTYVALRDDGRPAPAVAGREGRVRPDGFEADGEALR